MFLMAGSVLNKRWVIYLFAFLVIQVMILFTIFEFIRKPWEGKELEIEKIQSVQQNNLFESISSMHTFDDENQMGKSQFGGLGTGINHDQGISSQNNLRQKQDKKQVLMEAYQNPFEGLLHENTEQDEFQAPEDGLPDFGIHKGMMMMEAGDGNQQLHTESSLGLGGQHTFTPGNYNRLYKPVNFRLERERADSGPIFMKQHPKSTMKVDDVSSIGGGQE